MIKIKSLFYFSVSACSPPSCLAHTHTHTHIHTLYKIIRRCSARPRFVESMLRNQNYRLFNLLFIQKTRCHACVVSRYIRVSLFTQIWLFCWTDSRCFLSISTGSARSFYLISYLIGARIHSYFDKTAEFYWATETLTSTVEVP